MNTKSLRKQASKLVLAIALATGTAMVAGHIAPDEAHAQRSKKKKKKDKESEPKSEYSKEWREAFVPLQEKFKAEDADVSALLGEIEAVVALAKSGDELLQTGQLIYNAGIGINDLPMRLRGMEMMIGSGKVPAAAIGQYNFISFQLADNLKDYQKARTYLQAAIDQGYTRQDLTAADLQVAMAQNYFNANEYPAGLVELEKAIEAKIAAGETVEERLYDIGFSVAYREDIQPQVYDYAIRRAQLFPDTENWINAINLVRVLNDLSPEATLDLLRLSRAADVLTDKQEYIIYVETADARALPQEVKDVIEEGYASGALDREDTYVSDQYRIANDRVESDRADLPELENDAMAADAGVRTVAAAASAFLSYGQYDKAVAFYQKALTMPGVETDETLTRLGIAQVGAQDYAGAQETFAKVAGERGPVARVWAGYAGYEAGGM
ncbi:MAG: hypothetical protein AAFR64_13260 [Pseudomonadota bacterium]